MPFLWLPRYCTSNRTPPLLSRVLRASVLLRPLAVCSAQRDALPDKRSVAVHKDQLFSGLLDHPKASLMNA